MTWEDITLRQFEELTNKPIKEALLILANDLTLTQFKNTDWSFLNERPQPELPKKEYVLNGKTYTPTLDPRKFTVSQYLTFTSSKDTNSKLNAIFNTTDVDYGDMSIVDVESLMYFFVMQLQTCIIGTQRYLLQEKKMNQRVKEKLLSQIASLNNLVFSCSSNQ